MNTSAIGKEESFLDKVQAFRKTRVSKLRSINHWWNIILMVMGITLTAITTILGVIDNPQYKDLIKVGIAFSGSVAVLAQSANKEFRVKGKAGKYALVEADLLVIEHKLRNIENPAAAKELYEEFYEAIRTVGEIECETEGNQS